MTVKRIIIISAGIIIALLAIFIIFIVFTPPPPKTALPIQGPYNYQPAVKNPAPQPPVKKPEDRETTYPKYIEIATQTATKPAASPTSIANQKRLEWLSAMEKCQGIRGIKTRQKIISLTFDDGPNGKYTEAILDILKRYHINATFFIIGKNALRYPHLVKAELEENNILANHSFAHNRMSALNAEEAAVELNTTDSVIFKLTGVSPILFRPPYGVCSDESTSVTQQLGYQTIIWSDISDDYDINKTTPQNIAKEIIALARPGGILALHDGGGDRTKTVAALPIIINTLLKRGYTFVPLSRLLGINPYRVMVIDKTNIDHTAVAESFERQRSIDNIVIYTVPDPMDKSYNKEELPHYLITRKGTIYRLLPEDSLSHKNYADINNASLLIELINTETEQQNIMQYRSLRKLIDTLQHIYKITDIKNHTQDDS